MKQKKVTAANTKQEILNFCSFQEGEIEAMELEIARLKTQKGFYQGSTDSIKTIDTLKVEIERVKQELAVSKANETKCINEIDTLKNENKQLKSCINANDTNEIEELKARIIELENSQGGRQRNTDIPDSEVIQLHKNGLSLRQIREKTKLSLNTIQKILKGGE